uniref:Uncharacterized protein n=1 Tax=Oryza meridionalis TaxID=40149 RepID=A0A0E0BZC4_9ORYZ
MDISQATKEPLPSHGQHQLFGRDYNTSIRHRCQTSLHPNNPRGLGLAECQGKKAFEPKGPSIVIDVKELPQSDAPKEDTTRNTVAARPKPEQDLWGKWQSAMTTPSRRETAPTASSSSNRPKARQGFRQRLHITHTSPPHRRPHDSPRRLTSSQPSTQPTVTHTPLLHRPEPAKAAKGPVVEARLAIHAAGPTSTSASHRRHKRPQPRCTAAKTPVGAAGGCHRADKGLATASVAAPAPPAAHPRVVGSLHAAGRSSTCHTGLPLPAASPRC